MTAWGQVKSFLIVVHEVNYISMVVLTIYCHPKPQSRQYESDLSTVGLGINKQ